LEHFWNDFSSHPFHSGHLSFALIRNIASDFNLAFAQSMEYLDNALDLAEGLSICSVIGLLPVIV
jgi:hypothetical protein